MSVNVVVIANLYRICLVIALAIVIAGGTVNAQNADAKLISSPAFILSSEAVTAGIDGNVKVSLTIKKDGTVKSVQIVAGPAWPCGTSPEKELEDVRKAIKGNVLAAKFQPVMKDGKTKEVDVVMTFTIGEAYRKLQRERERQEAIAAGRPVPSIIKGGVLNGRALSLPKPPYPAEAKAQRASGSASIEVLIDESGKVIQAGAVSGWHVFQRESRLAACASRFSPTLLEGKPVKVSGVITYNFGA